MRPKLIERKEVIRNYITRFYGKHIQLPSERDISSGTGIPLTSVHRFLVEMRDNGELHFDGRKSARTDDLDYVTPGEFIPVLGTVACGPGQEEEEQLVEYIHMPQSMVGKEELFALIAKGRSMVDAGVYPGDYVFIRKQQTANNGDIVVALLDGMNNLKKLVKQRQKYILRSCNKKEKSRYPDIIPENKSELRIQGVAVGVYHCF